MLPRITPPRTELRPPRRRGRAGQALIEVYFAILLFMFVGILIYEAAICVHNLNVVNNALKQAAWLASMGADDEDIGLAIDNCDTAMMHSLFFMHRVHSFGISVWVVTSDTTTGMQGTHISPRSLTKDMNLTPGNVNRASYIYRANGYNIRVGLQYVLGYSSVFFGADPVFTATIPLTASHAIIAQNDEDRDGLVDIYEPEIYMGLLAEASTSLYSHRDWGQSDTSLGNVDGDSIVDQFEAGLSNYDWDNDGWLDNVDPNGNRLRHPVLGDTSTRVALP